MFDCSKIILMELKDFKCYESQMGYDRREINPSLLGTENDGFEERDFNLQKHTGIWQVGVLL